MFDTIGQTVDEGGAQRRAASVVLLTTLAGGLLATVFVIGAYTAAELVAVSPVGEIEFHEVAIEVTIETPLPAVPSPPPPLIARGVEADSADPVDVQPDDMADPTDDLDTPPSIAVVDAAPEGGSPDGVDGGDPDGAIDGRQGGVLNSTGDDVGAIPAVPTVHRSEVRLKRSVTPDYPEAARSMNLGEVDCRVSILISEEGVAQDMQFQSCPAVFHESVRTAVARMRWYPYRVGGQKSAARFVIQFRFRQGA